VAHLLEKTQAPTISLRAARAYVNQLRHDGDVIHGEVADKLAGLITVAELSGQERVNVDAALAEAMAVEYSIDALIDLVIDLR
jgi:hypothetical protein